MLKHAGFDVSEQAAGGAFLSSASVTRSHCRQPAERRGWMASCIASGSHWAGVPDITWQAAWQSRSVKIPCLERFAGARYALATPCARSALTTGPGARDASTAPSFVISTNIFVRGLFGCNGSLQDSAADDPNSLIVDFDRVGERM
jgi:hypothetical protein